MIVAGFGFSTRANQYSLQQALLATGFGQTVTSFATVAEKACAPQIQGFAADRNVPITPVSVERLSTLHTPTTSQRSLETYGTGSVAEAAALAAAGPGARIVILRQISDDGLATCAIAEGGPT